jgi:nitronate monooxygenase
MHGISKRVGDFQSRFGLERPILLAPMAGACPPSLSIAIQSVGGMGACGAVLMQPAEILTWAEEVRRDGGGRFQINLWIPEAAPKPDPVREAKMRSFLAAWGPEVPAEAADVVLPNFSSQCEALMTARPLVASSIMGVYPPAVVTALQQQGIAWFANATTVAEARAAQRAGADVIVAQGCEAGGHRGSFDASVAERQQVGLFALLPAIVDAVPLPVVAAGGIADARGIAAALILGASAVQIGTGFLRCQEAKTHPAWADAIGRTAPEDTVLTRAFSGRAGRSIATAYVRASMQKNAPVAAPYPTQRGLTAPMRRAAQVSGDVDRMQTWAGQSAALAKAEPAAELVKMLWQDAQALLP